MKYNLAIVGATGKVGRTFFEVLQESFVLKKINKIFLFASEKSAGQKIDFCGRKIEVELLCEKNIKNKKVDFAFFSAGEGVSKKFAKFFTDHGCVVIDNSSAFRMDENVPLVVPEINFNNLNSKLIANPNCSTIQAVLPLYYLQKNFGLKKVNYVTFQAVSGSGQKGIEDLERAKNGEKTNFYPYPIYNNCLPHIGSFLKNGFTSEEMKMINETRKILNQKNLKISATCVRVPVKNCHAVCVSVLLNKTFKINDIKNLFKTSVGIKLVDDVEKNVYPINMLADGKNEVLVGRIRQDIDNKKLLHFYCVADNLRKGAALNGVQILEKILKNK